MYVHGGVVHMSQACGVSSAFMWALGLELKLSKLHSKQFTHQASPWPI